MFCFIQFFIRFRKVQMGFKVNDKIEIFLWKISLFEYILSKTTDNRANKRIDLGADFIWWRLFHFLVVLYRNKKSQDCLINFLLKRSFPYATIPPIECHPDNRNAIPRSSPKKNNLQNLFGWRHYAHRPPFWKFEHLF